MLKERSYRLVNHVHQFLVGLAHESVYKVGIVTYKPGHGLGANTPFCVGTGGEFVTGSTHTVTGGKQTVNRGHTVVNLVFVTDLILFRYPIIIRSGGPQTAAAGMRSQQVRLGGHNLGVFLVRLRVRTAPQVGLTAGHIKEVFPGFGLKRLNSFLLTFAPNSLRAVIVSIMMGPRPSFISKIIR